MKLLDNKTAIITGAGRPHGMGRATALKFAEHGARVIVTDLVRSGHADDDQASIDAVVEEVRALGCEALGLGVDVTQRDAVDACVAQTVESFGGVDVLVCNAGTSIGAGPFLEQTDVQWDVSYQVHLKGPLYFSQAVIPHMQAAGGGAIVNNASMLGVAAEAFTAAYTATKFGLVGLTKVIAAEFGPDNIRCNAVCPGAVDTLMQQEGLRTLAADYGKTYEEMVKSVEDQAALKRQAQADEIADAILYLASPMSSYVSGVSMLVHGGANPGL